MKKWLCCLVFAVAMAPAVGQSPPFERGATPRPGAPLVGDAGVDIAVVMAADGTPLRAAASAGAAQTARVARGGLLVPLSQASGGFLRVLDVGTSERGYVRAADVWVQATKRPTPALSAGVVDTAAPGKIRFRVVNQTSKPLTFGAVGAGRETWVRVGPGKEAQMTLAPGAVRLLAASPGTLPAVAVGTLKPGLSYTWRLRQATRTQ